MKSWRHGLVVTIIVLTCAVAGSGARAADNPFGPFAVVELFTSEGCSSCPPADALLRQLVAQARAKNLRIFPLSFHVDYWNYLGWTDPFSSPVFTRRQGMYAKTLNADEYTPQAVVNGTTTFGGYRQDLLQEATDEALRHLAPVGVHLSLGPYDITHPRRIEIRMQVENLQPDRKYRMNVAVVERGLTDEVRRGENRGQTLRHDNVVKIFKTYDIKEGAGTLMLDLPESIDRQNASLILYVQDAVSMAIEGAAQADLALRRKPG